MKQKIIISIANPGDKMMEQIIVALFHFYLTHDLQMHSREMSFPWLVLSAMRWFCLLPWLSRYLKETESVRNRQNSVKMECVRLCFLITTWWKCLLDWQHWKEEKKSPSWGEKVGEKRGCQLVAIVYNKVVCY